MASDVRLAEITAMFRRHGWHLERVSGSHHVFKSPTGQTYSVPAHKGRVKYVYYRQAQKILGEG